MNLSLENALSMALSNNLSLRDASIGQRAAAAKVSQTASARNPKVVIAGLGSQQVFASQDLTSGVYYNDVATEFQFSKMLFPSPSLRHDLFQDTIDEQKAHLDKALSRNDVILQTRTIYWRIVTLSTLRRFQGEQLQRSEHVFKAAKTRERLGFGDLLDTKWAGVQFGLAQDAVLQTESAIQTTEIQLRQILGLTGSQSLHPTDALPSVRSVSNVFLDKADVEDISPQLQIAQREIDKAAETKEYVSRRWWPDVSFSGGYNLPDGRAAIISLDSDWNLALLGRYPVHHDFPITYPSNYSLNFRCALPIYDGARVKKSKEYASEVLDQKENQWAITRTHLATQVARDRQSLMSLASRAENLHDLSLLADESVKAAQVKYRRGVISLLDLAKVESDDTEAQRKYLEAFYELIAGAESLKKDLLIEEYRND